MTRRPGRTTAAFRAKISVPIASMGPIKSNVGGRCRVIVKHGRLSTTITMRSGDLHAFRASLNSALRDMVVVGTVSKAARRAMHRKPV